MAASGDLLPSIRKNNNRVRSLDTTSIPNALRTPGTEGYSECAATLILQYETIVFEELHRAELHLLPTTPGFVLDIGAGIGIDAAWFAARGHRVVAVEPTEEFRIAGEKPGQPCAVYRRAFSGEGLDAAFRWRHYVER
ncbi:hypothetical protein [Methylomonas fluvii]|uniref:hypothetical protein n=1 Tax=Methylomonas fluvii TaxID=1854564 RepID=UPI001CE13DFB|nr:hypothetical protein [Methylomonas fluvii]